jgi:hypothetical protein
MNNHTIGVILMHNAYKSNTKTSLSLNPVHIYSLVFVTHWGS